MTTAEVKTAFALAQAAADAAGIRAREADSGEMAAVVELFEGTWGPGRSPGRPTVQALDHAGNTVLIATDAQGPVGATLGFLGWKGGLHLHSHMNAVVPARRGGGVGYALKLLQRAICLHRGIVEMRWTFDPLIRRNARFNLVKLGAEITSFLPDFYGRLDDAITGSDHSDRFEVRWRLSSPRVERALEHREQPRWRGEVTFALEADYEALRAEWPANAAAARSASREAFPAALSNGLRPELNAEGDYVFTRDDVDRDPVDGNAVTTDREELP
jgi:predicted GNAT superfamily acetyltransferase